MNMREHIFWALNLYLGILGWKAKCQVTEFLFCEVVLKPGEEEDSPVVDADWLKVLLRGLLLSSHHLNFMSESSVSIFV